MANKRKPVAGSGITNAVILRETGLRRLTKDEEKRLGVKSSQVLYTSQKAGVKKLDRSKTVSKRQARQRTLDDVLGAGRGGKRRTLETEATRLRAERGNRAPQDTYKHYRDLFAKKSGMTKREVAKNAEFQKLYKDLRNSRKSKAATKKRIAAVNYFRSIDPRFAGENPIEGSD